MTIHSLGYWDYIIENGEVYIWGNSEFGQTGLGNKEAQHLPIRMEFFRDKSIGSTSHLTFISIPTVDADPPSRSPSPSPSHTHTHHRNS
jgi:hypothetical protein